MISVAFQILLPNCLPHGRFFSSEKFFRGLRSVKTCAVLLVQPLIPVPSFFRIALVDIDFIKTVDYEQCRSLARSKYLHARPMPVDVAATLVNQLLQQLYIFYKGNVR